MDSLNRDETRALPEVFANRILPLEELPQAEAVDLKPLEPQYKTVLLLQSSIMWLVLLFGSVFMLWVRMFSDGLSNWQLLFPAFIVFFWILHLSLIAWSFRYRGYALREHDIWYGSGVIARERIAIPLNRVQHVALHEGAILRLFGLAALRIYTAGGGSSDLEINGIPKATAERLKSYLLQHIRDEKEITVEEEAGPSDETPNTDLHA